MQPLQMERIDLQLYKDKNPPTDVSQVPAVGATYSVFRQGATVSGPVGINSSSIYRVPVHSIGHARADDHLQLARDLSAILLVVGVDPQAKWFDVQFDFQGAPLALVEGDRLIPIYGQPTLYSEGTGSIALPTSVVTLDSGGRATFFCRETPYDAVLVGAGANRVLLDQRGGWGSVLNAADFGSIQEAVEALPSRGGTVFVPSGVWTNVAFPRYSRAGSSTLSLPRDRSVRVLGAGVESTILQSNDSSQPIVLVQGDNSVLEGLTIESTAILPVSGTPSRGVVVGRTGENLTRVALTDCVVRNTPGYGVYVCGEEMGTSIVTLCHYCRVRVAGNKSEGGIWVGQGVTTQFFDDCGVTDFKGVALESQGGGGITFTGCLFEKSLDYASPYVILNSASNIVFDRCWFESHEAVDTQYFIQLLNASRAIEVRSTRFSRGSGVSNARLITIAGVSRSIVLINLEVLLTVPPTGLDDINVQNAESEVILIGGVVAEPLLYHPIRVNAAPPRSAWLGTNRRVRVPQASDPEVEALTDAADGDLVFNSTTQQIMVRQAGAWMNVLTVSP